MTTVPLPGDTELCILAIQHSTDKAPRSGHGYTPYYHELFKDRRDAKKILEIGIDVGASLRMWRDYFPQAEIYAMDCDDKKLITETRIRSFYGNQGDEHHLRMMMKWFGPDFDLILDDGSHQADHQILSANVLVPFLSPTGIYIIEDVLYPKLLVPHIKYKCEIVSFDLIKDPYNNLIVIHGGSQ